MLLSALQYSHYCTVATGGREVIAHLAMQLYRGFLLAFGIYARRCLSSNCICSRKFLSSAPSGSSINTKDGSKTKARATATRCCCPPESCPGRRLPKASEAFAINVYLAVRHSKPASIIRHVVLPEPDGPSSKTHRAAPGAIAKLWRALLPVFVRRRCLHRRRLASRAMRQMAIWQHRRL